MASWQAGVMNSMDDAVLGEPESYGIDFESLSSVPESQLQLTEKDMTVLRNHVPDPLEDDRNSDNDLYIKFCETLKRVRYLP